MSLHSRHWTVSRVLSVKAQQVGKYESFSEYLNDLSSGEGDRFLNRKVSFAEKITRAMQAGDWADVLDLDDRLAEAATAIQSWNGMNDLG